MTIKNRINLTFLTIFIVVMMMVIIFIGTFVRQSIRSVIFNELEATVQSKAAHIETYIKMLKGRIVDFSSDGKIKDCLFDTEYFSDSGCTFVELSEHLHKNKLPAIEGLYEVSVLNADGLVIGTTNRDINIRDDFSSHSFFIVDSDEPYVGDVYFNENDSVFEFTISAPIYIESAGQEARGVVMAKLISKDFYEIITNRAGLGETGEILLAKKNENGDAVFFSPKRFEVGHEVKSVIDKEDINILMTQALFKDGGLFTRVVDYRNVKVVSAVSYIKEIDWGMVVKIDESEAYAPIFYIFYILIIIFIFGVIAYMGVSIWLTIRLTKSIISLYNGIKIIKAGNLDYKVGTNSQDEIGQLSRVFDEMTLAIKKSRIEIDKKVEKQTKEIKNREKLLEDQQTAILNILEDVADEKNKTEIIANDLKKFELAVDNASDQIVITDPEGIILYVNKAMEKITGFKVSEVMGKKSGTKELWGGKMSLEFYQKMWKTIKIDKKTFSGELINHRKDGTDYNVLASITPVLNNKNEVIYLVAIERDITREKEIDKMKTEFVSVASHQLRTPLTAIRWYVEEIHNEELGKLNKEQKDYLKQVLESNDRMIHLVNDLLNVSRLESGRVTIEPVPTNIAELISGVIAECNILAKARNCDIEFMKPKTKLSSINIDPSLIRQVVNNLITNAVKYSKSGRGKSSVTVRLSKKEPNVMISVKDNGIGIPQEHQHRVFEKFFRADNAVKSETEGTGLGLYIAKNIVESSGGKIWFKSNDAGTTFTFTLPLSGSKRRKGEKSLA